jgi:hypothetical protein
MAEETTKWTVFWDMHSGGGLKEGDYDRIYIEAPEEEAKVIFYNRFGHNPERVTCTCCGDDYSISEYDSLAEASAYHRNCAWSYEDDTYVEAPERRYRKDRPLISVEEYCAKNSVLVVRAEAIPQEQREGSVPEQGYVWVE